jgi:hypothetical protein
MVGPPVLSRPNGVSTTSGPSRAGLTGVDADVSAVLSFCMHALLGLEVQSKSAIRSFSQAGRVRFSRSRRGLLITSWFVSKSLTNNPQFGGISAGSNAGRPVSVAGETAIASILASSLWAPPNPFLAPTRDRCDQLGNSQLGCVPAKALFRTVALGLLPSSP